MFRRSFFHKLIWAMAITIAVWGRPGECRAAGLTVAAGYDLFQSVTGVGSGGTNFMGVDFTGVPLNTFNFGGTIGVQNVGPTDTIIQRLSTVTVLAPGQSAITGLNVLALQLETTAPTTVFGPLANYFITLTPAATSTGSMNITFASTAGGTFTSQLDLFFDIHMGALNGPVVASEELMLSNSGAAWGRIPPPGSVLINGVNNFLNGNDNSQDFFINPPLIEAHPTAGQHQVQEAGTIPEPSAWVMGTIAAVAGLAYTGWRRRAAGV